MSKFRRLVNSCVYKSLVDGSLLKSTRRHIQDKNIHQIIVMNTNKSEFSINAAPLEHASNGFLIGIINYLPGEPSIHTNHAVSAILTNGRLYGFNAHGSDSQSMRWLVKYIRDRGLQVTDFMQYSGPNLQALDTEGACTQFSSRFLKLHPNAGMTQMQFNDYIVRNMTQYSLEDMYKYLNDIKSIRNVGTSSNNNNNNGTPMNVNVNMMNINRSRKIRARRPINRMNTSG
jgi:hypothetical protein